MQNALIPIEYPKWQKCETNTFICFIWLQKYSENTIQQ